jgi:hypothetical protein
MFAANTYRIRPADDADADMLRRFAAFDSGRPLTGGVLIGEIAGAPAAALSLRDGRVHIDPSLRNDHLVAVLRVRADAIRAYGATPSLRERMLAGLGASYHARSTVASDSSSHDADPGREPMLAYAGA